MDLSMLLKMIRAMIHRFELRIVGLKWKVIRSMNHQNMICDLWFRLVSITDPVYSPLKQSIGATAEAQNIYFEDKSGEAIIIIIIPKTTCSNKTLWNMRFYGKLYVWHER